MKSIKPFLLAASAIMATAPAFSAEVTINADRVAVIDGQPTFILGLYENLPDDAVLKAAAEAGINLVHSSATKESLDRIQNAGAGAWLNTGYDIDFSADAEAKKARLAEAVNTLGAHPALIVWEVPDEALWNAWYLAEVWRVVDEPRQLKAAAEALEDKALAAKLTTDLEEIKRLHKHGMWAAAESLADSMWTAMGKDIPQPGYGISTAPERAAKLGEGMLLGYHALREIDPKHPVWMNHAPRNTIEDLAFFDRAADIVGCDIYPVPETHQVKHSDLANRTLSSVGAYTRRMQDAAPGKPTWMVLQGTGWGDFQEGNDDTTKKLMRRPRKDETRFMAYDAIVHGARGILYWGTQFVEKDSAFWIELLDVVKELDGLQHVLTAPDSPTKPMIGIAPTNRSLDRTVATLSKAVPGGDWHIIVNEFESPLAVTVAGLSGNYRVHGEEMPVEAGDGSMVLYMPAYSAAVLAPVQ